MPGALLAVIVGLAVSQAALFLTTIYLHRTVSHRAVKMSKPLDVTCRFLLWITTGIRAREWAAVHRKHHAYTDVPGDPHSPIIDGFWAVQLNNVGMYRKVAKDGVTMRKYCRDLPPDRWDRILFDHSLLGLAIGVGLLWLLLGWKLAIVAAVVHTLSYLALNAAVNAIGHTFGKRLYSGLATNNQWLAALTGGEGLHSNHHAAPTSARLSFHKGEWDPGWWVISALRKVKLLSVRHDEVHLSAAARRSPELV